jgi:8-oxo-dGTP diphosphatase
MSPALAYDHRIIIGKGLERLRAKLEYSNIICKMMPKEFTLTYLQKAYEIILNKKLDKRNFRKKIMALKLVKATKNFDTSKPNRPAQLFIAASSQVNMTRVLS